MTMRALYKRGAVGGGKGGHPRCPFPATRPHPPRLPDGPPTRPLLRTVCHRAHAPAAAAALPPSRLMPRPSLPSPPTRPILNVFPAGNARPLHAPSTAFANSTTRAGRWRRLPVIATIPAAAAAAAPAACTAAAAVAGGAAPPAAAVAGAVVAGAVVAGSAVTPAAAPAGRLLV